MGTIPVGSPSPFNNVMGGGHIFESVLNPTTLLYDGWRDLGHITMLTYSNELTRIPHMNQRGKMPAADIIATGEITPTISTTPDEFTPENYAMQTLGNVDQVQQSAGYVEGVLLTAHLGKRTDLLHKEIGLYELKYDGGSGIFAVDEIVSGTTGVGTVVTVVGDAASGTLLILLTVAGFVDDDVLTGSVTGAAVAAGIEMFKSGAVKITDSGDTIVYAPVTDYYFDTNLRDQEVGRVLFPQASTIVDGSTDNNISYNYLSYDMSVVYPFTNPNLERQVRFVSDYGFGANIDILWHRVQWAPNGETSLLTGGEWGVMPMTGSVLKDSTVPANESPYYRINIKNP